MSTVVNGMYRGESKKCFPFKFTLDMFSSTGLKSVHYKYTARSFSVTEYKCIQKQTAIKQFVHRVKQIGIT